MLECGAKAHDLALAEGGRARELGRDAAVPDDELGAERDVDAEDAFGDGLHEEGVGGGDDEREHARGLRGADRLKALRIGDGTDLLLDEVGDERIALGLVKSRVGGNRLAQPGGDVERARVVGGLHAFVDLAEDGIGYDAPFIEILGPADRGIARDERVVEVEHGGKRHEAGGGNGAEGGHGGESPWSSCRDRHSSRSHPNVMKAAPGFSRPVRLFHKSTCAKRTVVRASCADQALTTRATSAAKASSP